MRRPFPGVALLSLVVQLSLTAGCGGERPRPADSSQASPPAAPVAVDTAPGERLAGETSTLPHTPADRAGEYRMAGNEPFWSVRVTRDGLRYVTPDYKDGIRFPASAPEESPGRLRWIALTAAPEAHTLEVVLEARRCQDSMADKSWTHVATVVFDGTTLHGCGERTR